MPVRIDLDEPDAAAADAERSYQIVFRPKPEMLQKANEPLFIIRELRKLGELDLFPEPERLPPFAELAFDRPYIGWTGTLRTAATRERIDEVFEFVIGDCEIEVTPDGPMPAAEPAAPAPAGAVVEMAAPPIQPAMIAAPAEAEPAADAVHPAEATAARNTAAKPAAAGATTTRVELEKIDRVVNMVGELVIAQAMLGAGRSRLAGGRAAAAWRRCSTRSCITRANSKTASCRCGRSR